MLLSEPGRTSYDLEFSSFGFPVRVHPAFFIMPVLLGGGLVGVGDINVGVGLLLVSAVFFVSILVHELGHAFAYRRYGMPARIVLYWMGGLAISDSGGAWSRRYSGSLNSNQKIVVSAAGPAAGFLLALVCVAIVYLLGGQVELDRSGVIPLPEAKFEGTVAEGIAALEVIFSAMFFTNILWGVLNLVPIYPLDGGQIAREVMGQMDSFNGLKNSIILSIVCAGLIALFALANRLTFMAFFFGYMAYTNYQMLEQYGGRRW